MTISWTDRERPPVTAPERLVSRVLWRLRLLGQRLAATSDFSGPRFRAYLALARLEERWARRVSQADLHLATCPRCLAPKMHAITRPGRDRAGNRRVCFGCGLDSPHGEEH